jgi:hypothetical protein
VAELRVDPAHPALSWLYDACARSASAPQPSRRTPMAPPSSPRYSCRREASRDCAFASALSRAQ